MKALFHHISTYLISKKSGTPIPSHHFHVTYHPEGVELLGGKYVWDATILAFLCLADFPTSAPVNHIREKNSRSPAYKLVFFAINSEDLFTATQ
ncbi:hypothetical protein SK128_009786, partial [Halocaridina rubra]